jgi:hypothetical protein
MSYEEEDTCHRSIEIDRYTSIESSEEKDTCHMRRRIHVI